MAFVCVLNKKAIMKAILLVASLACCLLACKKSEPISSGIFGKWELRRQYGGFIIPPDSMYKPGNGNILQFNRDSTYKKYIRGKLSHEGIYRIRKNGYRIDQNVYDELFFDSDISAGSLISLTGSSLTTIKPLVPDISSWDYEKMQN
jgi:hypothetical protein